VRVVAHGASDAERSVRVDRLVPLFVVGGHTPRLQHEASLVATDARRVGGCGDIARDHIRVRLAVPRLFPLFREGIVGARVALAACSGGVARVYREAGEGRVADIRRFGVGQPRPVAALALHVVVSPGGHAVVASVAHNRIPPRTHRVTTAAQRLGFAGRLQVRPSVRVHSLHPAPLVIDVAIPAGGLLVGRIEVAEETSDRVGRRVERVTIDELRVGAGSEGQGC